MHKINEFVFAHNKEEYIKILKVQYKKAYVRHTRDITDFKSYNDWVYIKKQLIGIIGLRKYIEWFIEYRDQMLDEGDDT